MKKMLIKKEGKEKRSLFFSFFLVFFLVTLSSCSKNTLSPEDKCGFIQNKFLQRISLGGKSLKLYIHDDIERKFHDSFREAAKRWNRVLQKPFLYIEPHLPSDLKPQAYHAPMEDGYSVLYMRKESWNASSTIQAFTITRNRGDRIVEADVVFNHEDFTFSLETKRPFLGLHFLSLVMHEFGHIAGRDDSTSLANRIMNETLPEGVIRLEFDPELTRQLQCEYPNLGSGGV